MSVTPSKRAYSRWEKNVGEDDWLQIVLPTGECIGWIDKDGILSGSLATGGGGTPAGSDGDIQFNDSGAFGANSNLNYSDDLLLVKGPGGGSYEGSPAMADFRQDNDSSWGWVTTHAQDLSLFTASFTGAGAKRGYYWFHDGTDDMFIEMGAQSAPFTGKNVLVASSLNSPTGYLITETLLGIAPFADNEQVIGIPTRRYKELHLSGGAFLGGNVGFYGTTPVGKQTVTGSKDANAALASLMTALAAYGFVTDSTS